MIRIGMLFAMIFMLYCTLVFRLWNEQVRYGEEHRRRISKQSIRCIREPGIRGRILTRDMKVVAGLRQEREILFHLSEMRKPGKLSKTIDHIIDVAARISTATGRRIEVDEEKIKQHIYHKPALPMKVAGSLSDEELGRFCEIFPRIPGVDLGVSYVRDYPMGDFAAQVVGYLGKEDPADAEDRERFFYYQPDFAGRTGIERLCDKSIGQFGVNIGGLRGAEGYSLVRVDTQGFVDETVETLVPPSHGKSVMLTLDSKAQETAEFILLGQAGAFVLLDCANGDVLAMASSPAFNPGVFVPAASRSDYSRLSRDPLKPFLNRATSAAYTPGSILKPLIALAILDSGGSPLEQVNCPGYATIGNQRIRCWRTDGHGELAMVKAIEQSCNVYFIEEGVKTGFDRIKSKLEQAGLGRKTGFDLSESAGLAPSREYKKRATGEKWTVFDTAILSIGQGTVLLTPLQVATYMSAIANRGSAFRPRIVKAAFDHQGNLISGSRPAETHLDMGQPEGHFDTIRQGMHDVVNTDTGTGRKARSEKITVFGKTGTAEIVSAGMKGKNTWFAGFAENEGGKYAFALVVENGISGGTTCAPKIKQFFNDWLD